MANSSILLLIGDTEETPSNELLSINQQVNNYNKHFVPPSVGWLLLRNENFALRHVSVNCISEKTTSNMLPSRDKCFCHVLKTRICFVDQS